MVYGRPRKLCQPITDASVNTIMLPMTSRGYLAHEYRRAVTVRYMSRYSICSTGILNSVVILVILLTRSFASVESLGVPEPLGPEAGLSFFGGSVSI